MEQTGSTNESSQSRNAAGMFSTYEKQENACLFPVERELEQKVRVSAIIIRDGQSYKRNEGRKE